MAADETRVDSLYGLDLDRFVPERDALAKSLRAAGGRARADEVRRLAKPTRAAWAVNRVIREHRDAARALAESGRSLAEAQQEVLAGGRPSVLREASDRARAAVDALVGVAPVSSGATADKIRETLTAATLDSEVLGEVMAARLARERSASGFGGLAAPAAGGTPTRSGSRARAAGSRPPRSTSADKGDGRPAARRTRGAAETRPPRPSATRAAERQDTRRRERLRKAKEAEARAEHELTAARRALDQLAAALAKRRVDVREAERRLKDAQRRRKRAEADAGSGAVAKPGRAA